MNLNTLQILKKPIITLTTGFICQLKAKPLVSQKCIVADVRCTKERMISKLSYSTSRNNFFFIVSMQEEPIIFKQIEQLIEACIKGERISQSKLYNHFCQKMFVVCLRYSKTREEQKRFYRKVL